MSESWMTDAGLTDPKLADPANESAKGPPGITIYQDGSSYRVRVTVDVCVFGSPFLAQLVYWLNSRTQTDIVVFTFVQTYRTDMRPAPYLTILNAIRITQARTYAMVDRSMSEMCAYCALACDHLIGSDFGLLDVLPAWSCDFNDLSKTDQALADIIIVILEDCVHKGLITQDQYEGILTRTPITITPDKLRELTDG